MRLTGSFEMPMWRRTIASLFPAAIREIGVALFVLMLMGCQVLSGRDTHERLHGVLWMQTAPEYAISTRMVYRSAMEALDQALENPDWTAAIEQTGAFEGRPPAVILDLDETVLDNSRMQGQLVINRVGSDNDVKKVWEEWVHKSAASSVPGALEFIRYAKSRNVSVFYVTNRTAAEESDTRKNLQNFGITSNEKVDEVLTKGECPPGRMSDCEWSSDKSSRRKYIANKYRILLLIGDDLGDFVSGARTSPVARRRLARQYCTYWGERWFLLPNPIYGSWESALYGNDSKRGDTEVLKMKFDAVRGFE